jgi:uncharacterized Zn finger protein
MSDPEPGERVALACPSCAPDLEVAHEVLSTGGGRATARCADCGHVHKERIEDDTVERDVVVSQDGESVTATVEGPGGETVARGEEFVVETEEAVMEVRITDLQVGDEQRTGEARLETVDTLWTRAVGNVGVNVTVNPPDGGDTTRSVRVYVPGDSEFVVGETESFGEEEFEVTHLHLRDDARGYEFEKLDHPGDAAAAKDVKRVYAEDAATAWSSPWG